jgi:hypothetical protein
LLITFLEEIDERVCIQHTQNFWGSKKDKPFQELQKKEKGSFNCSMVSKPAAANPLPYP